MGLEKSVNNHLLHMSKDTTLPIDNNNKRKTRVLGISTTNANDKMAPRKSTSEEALRFALDYAHSIFEAETVMIKLRELNFKHCEGVSFLHSSIEELEAAVYSSTMQFGSLVHSLRRLLTTLTWRPCYQIILLAR